MSRIGRITTITPTSSELYPVVHDLTEAEYGNQPKCGDRNGGGTLFGKFAIDELARPNLHARSLSSHYISPLSSPCDISKNQRKRQRRHSRTHSLLQLVSGHFSFGSSRLCYDDVEKAPGHQQQQHCTEDDNQIMDQPPTVSFDDVFVLTRQICRCKISTVWECVHREEGTRHCVKMIDKRRFTGKADHESALREMAMLTLLQPYQSVHVPRLLMITETDHQYCIVMDYVEGGNLSLLRQSRHHLPEKHVQSIARSLLLGVAELHRLSIAHWNLCPDNILLQPNLCDVVLCDFGCAWDLGNNNGLGRERCWDRQANCHGKTSTPRCGSLQYAAPELLGSDKEFGMAADMWSVGVILYQLLCGRLPFIDVSKQGLKEKIASGKFQFHGSEWHNISRGAKQFLSALLHPDPQVRMTVHEALSHAWLAPQKQRPNKCPEGTSSISRKPSYLIKNDQHLQGGLVQRLWANWRSSSCSDLQSSPSSSVPTPLKSHVELLLLSSPESDLYNASTLSIDSDSNASMSPPESLPWQCTLPIPLEHYRRLGHRR